MRLVKTLEGVVDGLDGACDLVPEAAAPLRRLLEDLKAEVSEVLERAKQGILDDEEEPDSSRDDDREPTRRRRLREVEDDLQ